MKRPIQFSLRTLLISTMILGPLSGWFVPGLINRLLDLFASDANSPRPIARISRLNTNPTPLTLGTFQAQLDAQQAELLASAKLQAQRDEEQLTRRTLQALWNAGLPEMHPQCVEVKHNDTTDSFVPKP